MRHAPGNTKDTYTCLSYVWGEEPASHSILIGNKTKAILPNLYNFLEQAKTLHHSKWLWIDTLCIDQSNTDERNHQVQQMGSIYERAEEVISWLGNDEAAIRCLDLDAEPSPSDNFEFSGLSYWNRAWITQEIALARRVVLMAGSRQLGLTNARSTKVWDHILEKSSFSLEHARWQQPYQTSEKVSSA